MTVIHRLEAHVPCGWLSVSPSAGVMPYRYGPVARERSVPSAELKLCTMSGFLTTKGRLAVSTQACGMKETYDWETLVSI